MQRVFGWVRNFSFCNWQWPVKLNRKNQAWKTRSPNPVSSHFTFCNTHHHDQLACLLTRLIITWWSGLWWLKRHKHTDKLTHRYLSTSTTGCLGSIWDDATAKCLTRKMHLLWLPSAPRMKPWWDHGLSMKNQQTESSYLQVRTGKGSQQCWDDEHGTRMVIGGTRVSQRLLSTRATGDSWNWKERSKNVYDSFLGISTVHA